MSSRTLTYDVNAAVVPASTAPNPRTKLARRPIRTAVVTTLVWNAVPLLALGAWSVLAARSDATSGGGGADWGGLLAYVVLVIIVSALAIAGGVGAAITAFLVRRRLRRAAIVGRPGITVRTAILFGSAGAGIGWVIGVVAVVLIPIALSFVSTLMS